MKFKILTILILCSLSQTSFADEWIPGKGFLDTRTIDQCNQRQAEMIRQIERSNDAAKLPPMPYIPPSSTDPRFIPRDTVGTFYIGPNGSYSPNNNYYAPPNSNNSLPYYYQP